MAKPFRNRGPRSIIFDVCQRRLVRICGLGVEQIEQAPYGILLAIGVITFASVYEYGEKAYRTNFNLESAIEVVERYIGRAAMVGLSFALAQQLQYC